MLRQPPGDADILRIVTRSASLWEGHLFFRASSIVLALAMLATVPAGAGDLASAYRIIAGKEFVDLTHSFGPTTLRR
jgi:hypothetical protein